MGLRGNEVAAAPRFGLSGCLGWGGPSRRLTRSHARCLCAARERSEAPAVCVTCSEKYPVFPCTQPRDTGAKQKRQGRAGQEGL